MILRTVLFTLAPAMASLSIAAAGELLYADGRTAVALHPKQDSSGRWTADVEGHHIRLKPGRMVSVTDDEGKTTDLIPALGDEALTPEAAAILEGLREPKNEMWEVGFETIAVHPTRAMLDDLIELAKNKDKRLRLRAVVAMTQLYTRESVTSAAQTILEERHKGTRSDAASALFRVREIFVRSDAMQCVPLAISDGDRTVRVIFALLAASSPEEVQEGVLAALRKDGVGNKDHHIREEAALALARLGDSSGLQILIGMLARKAVPGLEELSEERRTSILIEEHVSICVALGKLGDKSAIPALQKASKSHHPAVKRAAEAAIATIGE